jgi:hypothetical protein
LCFKQPKVTIFDFKGVCGGIVAMLVVKKYGKKKKEIAIKRLNAPK